MQGAITRTELLKRLRASLKHEGYEEVPQPGRLRQRKFWNKGVAATVKRQITFDGWGFGRMASLDGPAAEDIL